MSEQLKLQEIARRLAKKQAIYVYLRIENAEGYVWIAIYLYACYSHNSKSIKPNHMTFGGMIGYYPGTILLDFGIDRGKGQGHEKVNIFFLRGQFLSNWHATNAKMFIIQCPIL